MIRTICAALIISSMNALALPGIATAQEEANPDTLPLEGIVVVVNNEPILYSDVRQRVATLVSTLGTQPTPDTLRQLASTALDQLVNERLQLQTATESESVLSDHGN